MAETSLGEAIGLGTRVSGNDNSPLTRGLQIGQQNEFRKMQLEQQSAYKEQQEAERMAKNLTYDPSKWHNEKYGKEFGEYYKTQLPKMMEAQKKRDHLGVANMQIEIASKLGALQAIDKDEYEIGKYPAGKYATVDLLREKYNKGGFGAIVEHNENYPVPIAQVDEDSKHFTAVKVEDPKLDKTLDYTISKQMLGQGKFKVIGSVAGTPIYQVDENSPEYKAMKETIVNQLASNPDYALKVMATKDFNKFLDEYGEKTGIDRATLISEQGALPEIRREYIAQKYEQRIVNQVKKAGKPKSGGSDNAMFFVGGKNTGKFTFTPREDGYISTDSESTPGIALKFAGDVGGKAKIVGVYNPAVKYLGGELFEVVGREEGKSAYLPPVAIVVPTSAPGRMAVIAD